jgi:hypothetical protein
LGSRRTLLYVQFGFFGFFGFFRPVTRVATAKIIFFTQSSHNVKGALQAYDTTTARKIAHLEI